MSALSDAHQVTEVPVDDEDFYHVLGVSHDASDKQINIAYKKLALKYHPDRNVDDEYAAIKYRAVNDAYHVLIDPAKRRLYDQRKDSSAQKNSVASTDVDVAAAAPETTAPEGTSLAGIGRVFGAVISRLGIPINTQISPDIIATAQAICRNGGIEGGGPPLDPRVSDLPWGWAAEAKVDRQTAAYYRLTADPQHTEIGFIVHGRSASKGKFKMIIFDKDGAVLHQIDSSKDKDSSYSQATFFFTTFDTYHLGDSQLSQQTGADKEKSFPPVLSRLDTFTHAKKKIASGQYLLCVYGDNLFGKTSFSIIAVPSKMDAPEVRSLEEVDDYLLESKRALEQLKNEYNLAKAAYEKVLEKISATEDKVDSEITRREKLYTGFIDASIREFSPITADFDTIQPAAPVATSGNIAIPSNANTSSVTHSSSPPSSGISVSLLGVVGKSVSSGGLGSSMHSGGNAQGATKPGAISTSNEEAFHEPGTTPNNSSMLGYFTTNTMSVASNAATVTTNAAQTATAAGGWIARRFSLGIQSIVKIPVGAQDPHDLGVSSDDSISVPERVMSPDGFSTVMSSPPNETDNYFDANTIPDSSPASPNSLSKPFPKGVVSLQAAATAAAAAVAAEQEKENSPRDPPGPLKLNMDDGESEVAPVGEEPKKEELAVVEEEKHDQKESNSTMEELKEEASASAETIVAAVAQTEDTGEKEIETVTTADEVAST